MIQNVRERESWHNHMKLNAFFVLGLVSPFQLLLWSSWSNSPLSWCTPRSPKHHLDRYQKGNSSMTDVIITLLSLLCLCFIHLKTIYSVLKFRGNVRRNEAVQELLPCNHTNVNWYRGCMYTYYVCTTHISIISVIILMLISMKY